MTWIKTRKRWELPESEVTPESTFWSRRPLLKTATAAALSLGSLPAIAATAGFPTTRNPRFSEEFGGLTPEKLVTGYNNFYEFTTDKEDVAQLAQGWETEPWTLQVEGLVRNPFQMDVNELVREFGIEQRIYRFRCVEAWSMVVPWDGFPLAKLVAKADPLSEAKYLRFVSFMDPENAPGFRNSYYPWPYQEGLRLDEARNELSLMVTGVFGKPLPNQNGAPLRLMVPWKYGFKSIKSIVRIEFVQEMPTTLWSAMAPREYGFYANVNPEVNHPRWSQARERPVGTWFQKIDTLKFNGYEPEVAALYEGMDLSRWY